MATSARYSLKKPRPDAEGDDHGDDHRVGAAAGQPRHQRRPEQEDQDRVPDLTEEDGGGPAPDGSRARSARIGVNVLPHRRTRVHQGHFPGRESTSSGERPAASVRPNSSNGAPRSRPWDKLRRWGFNATTTMVSQGFCRRPGTLRRHGARMSLNTSWLQKSCFGGTSWREKRSPHQRHPT